MPVYVYFTVNNKVNKAIDLAVNKKKQKNKNLKICPVEH